MITIASTTRSENHISARSYIANHQLAAFFVLAFAGAWMAFLPPLLAQNGIGILPFRLPLVLFLAAGSFTGPALATLLVAWAAGGKKGVQDLVGRYTIRPARYWWYVLAIFGPVEALLVGSSLSLGAAPLDAFRQQPVLFLSTYLVSVLSGLLVGPLGEEFGWRGFALPRLQKATGPLWGSLSLGVLWASWHLPLFFFDEWKGPGSALLVAVGFFSWVIPFTFVMTWVYNCSRGSLLIATLLHAGANAAVSLVTARILLIPNDLFFQAKIYGVLAVLLLVVTRGKLGVGSFLEQPVTTAGASDTQAGRGRLRLSRTQIAVGILVVIIVAYAAVNIGYDLIHGAK